MIRPIHSKLLIGLIAGMVFIPRSHAETDSQQAVVQRAARGIELHRKGDAVLQFVHENGAAGAVVQVTQTSHEFLFGNVVRPRHYQDERYRARFIELFNLIQLLEFNWGQYEPDEGRPLLEERLGFINGWCREQGLNHFYGHMLVWSTQYGDYPKTALPLWLFQYDRAKQVELLKARVQREVRDYRDVNILWDVVNEPTHARRWGDWDKRNYVDEPLEIVLPYVRDALLWARDANPEARLLVNDYRVVVQGKYRERYRRLLEMLKREGAPLHAVGIQAHEPFKGAYWYSPEEIWNTCELFGTQLGFPIYFTEFLYVADPKRKIEGNYRSGNWSPDRHGEAVEEFYRVAFGHPSVEAIIYFGLADDDVWQPAGGLLDHQYEPKPAWNRLKKLIRSEWMTSQSGVTDAAGTFRFRGFLGGYRIRATVGGRPREFDITLRKGGEGQWTLQLD